MKESSRTPDIRKQRGQSLVELAISLMVILMLLLGAFDFGTALFAYISMRDAAQEGAIYGSVEPEDQTGIRNRVVEAANDLIIIDPDDDIDIDVGGDTCEGSTGGDPNTITITIEHQHPVSTPLVGAMIGSQEITLRARVTNTILMPECD
jgi:Flp pilus assembly protein TadG